MLNIFRREGLQTWYTDGARRPVSTTSAVDLQGQGRKVTRCVWQCWPISRERKVIETPKLVGSLPTPRTVKAPVLKSKDQRSMSSGRLMLKAEVRHICGIGRPTNFKLYTRLEPEESHHRQRHMTSKVKGHGDGVTWFIWPMSRTKSLKNSKIGKWVAHVTNTNQFQGQNVKGQGHRANYYWD